MFTPEVRRLIDSDQIRLLDAVARLVGGVEDVQAYRTRVREEVCDTLSAAVGCARLHGLSLSRFVQLVRAEWRDQEKEQPDPHALGAHDEIKELWDGHD